VKSDHDEEGHCEINKNKRPMTNLDDNSGGLARVANNLLQEHLFTKKEPIVSKNDHRITPGQAEFTV
jgi:hypothetical protein